MKYKLLTLLFLMWISTFCCAQQLKPDTINKAKHASYIVKKSTYGSLHVNNNENVYQNKRSNQPQDFKIGKTDKHSVLNTFKQVFSADRLQELAADPSAMLIDYVVLPPTGKILEVSFILPKNSALKITELEALENALKANVVFRFRPEEIKSAEFVTINESVHFRKIVDGTLNENW